MVDLAAFAPDLMDRSKIAAAWPGCVVVGRLEGLPPAAIVIVDLSRPGVIEAIPDLVRGGARVIGFGSHVERGTLEAARAAGAEVMARSAFFSRLGSRLD